MFIVLVCGGRDFSDRPLLDRTMDRILEKHPDLVVLQGFARGTDKMAHEWAMSREVDSISVPARWNKDGKRAAGPIRNDRMLKLWRPNGVVAFTPGPSGTKHMVEISERAGLPVMKVGWE